MTTDRSTNKAQEKSESKTGFREFLEERRAVLDEKGTCAPCPFCGKNRVQRSDYIRCNNCSINWDEGENLDKDPRTERYRKMVAESRKTKASENEK